jgi:Domain of unknown function (DUF4304)
MTDDRSQMNRALKAFVVPKIRALGFVGSLPHFRRKRGSEHQMLMFMFNKYGGSFYLEAGLQSEAELQKLQESWSAAGKPLAESELTVGHCNRRARLGGTEVRPNADHWFVFGPDNQSDARYFQRSAHYDAIAAKVAHVVETQVETFFERAP